MYDISLWISSPCFIILCVTSLITLRCPVTHPEKWCL